MKAGNVPESTKPAAANEIKEDHTMSIHEIEAKARELRELRRMQEELAAEVEAIQDALKAHMDRNGMDTLLGIDWKITWKPVTSTRIDTAAIKKAMPDVAEAFTRTNTTRRFVLA